MYDPSLNPRRANRNPDLKRRELERRVAVEGVRSDAGRRLFEHLWHSKALPPIHIPGVTNRHGCHFIVIETRPTRGWTWTAWYLPENLAKHYVSTETYGSDETLTEADLLREWSLDAKPGAAWGGNHFPWVFAALLELDDGDIDAIEDTDEYEHVVTRGDELLRYYLPLWRERAGLTPPRAGKNRPGPHEDGFDEG